MESSAGVIAAVKSPLALAALGLLVLAQALRLILKRQRVPNALLVLTIKLGFGLATLLAVLALGANILEASLHREIRVSGSVGDGDGRPLSGVTIDIPGSGQTVSNASGAFEIDIAASRAADSYQLSASREGYLTKDTTIIGPQPGPLSLRLPRLDLTSGSILSLGHEVIIRNVIGISQVDLQATFTNPGPDLLPISAISASLRAPNGLATALVMVGTYMPAGGVGPALTTLQLHPHEPFPLQPIFSEDADQLPGLQAQVATALQGIALPTSPTRPTDHILPAGLVTALQGRMRSSFGWTAGTWEVTVTAQAGTVPISGAGTFVVTASQVDRLRKIGKYYAAGWGVLAGGFQLETADAASQVRLRLMP